jgi:hypothetical protein
VVKGIHRPGEKGDIFAQNRLITQFFQDRAKLTVLPTALHLEILAAFGVPIGDLLNG